MDTLLIEICCQCGFVHRDDRFQIRQRKYHFHWMPPLGELNHDHTTFHATVCLGCLGYDAPTAWHLFRQGLAETDPKYLSPGSRNARLPAYLAKRLNFMEQLNDAYYASGKLLLPEGQPNA